MEKRTLAVWEKLIVHRLSSGKISVATRLATGETSQLHSDSQLEKLSVEHRKKSQFQHKKHSYNSKKNLVTA
jgi:hypothetical protein